MGSRWIAGLFAALQAVAQRPPDANAASLRFSIGGQVVTADGSPLPDRLLVRLVCGGARIALVYTDSKGHFGFPGQSSSTEDCQVSANHPGYTSDLIDITNKLRAGSPNLGDLVIRPIRPVEGVTVSLTASGASKEARSAFEKGQSAIKKGRFDEATSQFEAAVKAYPGYADAWYQLGRAFLESKAGGRATGAFRKSMELDPKLVGPQVELGLIASQNHEWADSANYLDKALQLDPDSYPSAWFALGVARYNLKELGPAETAMREALQRDRQRSNPKIEYVLGLILADKGNYAEAASTLQDYLRQVPDAPDAARVKEMLSRFPNAAGPSSGPAK